MKKYLKVMLVLVVALSLLCTFALANPFEAAMQAAQQQSQGGTAVDNVNKLGGTVISVIQTIGYIVAVAMVLIVGIQWLIGTPAKKQELKGRMWNLVIGAILVAGGVTLLGWVTDIATSDLGISQNP